jgi:hypothetical protein
MLTRAVTFAVLLSASVVLSAGTAPIGSVVSQGDLQIDNYPAQSGATIFDGSVVETGNGSISSADVRRGGNIRLTLRSDSRGTFYRDHLVLLHGGVEVAATDSFRTEASALTISSSSPHADGLVSVGRDGTVIVSAQEGAFRVGKEAGPELARVSSQKPLSFSPTAGGEWRAGEGGPQDSYRDHWNCYAFHDDDRDCDRHHHRHPSK